jgi:hypothetical protein
MSQVELIRNRTEENDLSTFPIGREIPEQGVELPPFGCYAHANISQEAVLPEPDLRVA